MNVSAAPLIRCDVAPWSLFGISLGGRYTDGGLNISGGVNYSWVGDAKAGVADRAVASFEDNHVVGIGIRAEMKF